MAEALCVSAGVLHPPVPAGGARLCWLNGSLLALALHGGLIAWWWWPADPVMADNAPPAAIMIEWAESPQAVRTERNDISPERENAQASQAQARREAASEAAAAPAESAHTGEALQKSLPLAEKPLITQTAAQTRKSQRDQRQKAQQQKQQQEKEQEQQREQLASKQAIQSQVQTQPTARTAAQQTTASNSLSPQQQADWMGRVMAHLERRKRYPPAAQARGERGVATVKIALDGAGHVLTATLVSSSGFNALDSEVLALVRRASPLPPPPDGQPRRLNAPVQFFPR